MDDESPRRFARRLAGAAPASAIGVHRAFTEQGTCACQYSFSPSVVVAKVAVVVARAKVAAVAREVVGAKVVLLVQERAKGPKAKP